MDCTGMCGLYRLGSPGEAADFRTWMLIEGLPAMMLDSIPSLSTKT